MDSMIRQAIEMKPETEKHFKRLRRTLISRDFVHLAFKGIAEQLRLPEVLA